MIVTRRLPPWGLVLALLVACGPARAAEPDTGAAALAAREAEVLRRYQDLEGAFLRLADVLAATDPDRAAALRAAFDRGREARVGERIATIIEQLERGQLLKAGTAQEEAIEQFRAVLELLEAGGEGRLADARRNLQELVGRVAKVTARQREVEAATEAGADMPPLAARQREIEDEARRLAADAEALAKTGADAGARPKADGPPPDAPDGPPPAGSQAEDGGADAGDDESARARRTAQRLRAAEERMRAASGRLEEARRDEARAEQQRAVEELETARAELEEILRQMREEEVERILVQLEARIRGMLKAERAVRADTESLAAAAGSPRERQLEAARIGREQEKVGIDAAKALALVRDDGSAVAIPQALEQVRDDAAQAAARLARADVGRETVALVGDIVSGLEEMLAAVEKAHRDQAAGRSGQGGGAGAAAGEQPLVDALAELKMLRTLQVRVNARTQRLSRLLDDDPADDPDVRGVLVRLAERQRAIERAARDIVDGLTE
jgi:hypothetical protein